MYRAVCGKFETRTPINAILGMNEMILRESHEEEVQRYSADVDSAGKLLLVLVNDILDFSKLESGKMNLVKTEYALKPMILSATSLLKKTLIKIDTGSSGAECLKMVCQKHYDMSLHYGMSCNCHVKKFRTFVIFLI